RRPRDYVSALTMSGTLPRCECGRGKGSIQDDETRLFGSVTDRSRTMGRQPRQHYTNARNRNAVPPSSDQDLGRSKTHRNVFWWFARSVLGWTRLSLNERRTRRIGLGGLSKMHGLASTLRRRSRSPGS